MVAQGCTAGKTGWNMFQKYHIVLNKYNKIFDEIWD